jgi:hypothetical protein
MSDDSVAIGIRERELATEAPVSGLRDDPHQSFLEVGLEEP